MGMDLKPINPSDDAPLDEHGEPQWGRYNWTGWSWITNRLEEWGVTLIGFSGSNDGQWISKDKCKEVADAIEAHLHELEEDDRKWLTPHVALWRTCGGYEQW